MSFVKEKKRADEPVNQNECERQKVKYGSRLKSSRAFQGCLGGDPRKDGATQPSREHDAPANTL